eukprot:2620854-Pyramimonas_sp.AAC.3
MRVTSCSRAPRITTLPFGTLTPVIVWAHTSDTTVPCGAATLLALQNLLEYDVCLVSPQDERSFHRRSSV